MPDFRITKVFETVVAAIDEAEAYEQSEDLAHHEYDQVDTIVEPAE
jgi:hypothetical protein